MEWAWRDQRKITIRKLWMSPIGEHEDCVIQCLRCDGVLVSYWCVTACMCAFVFVQLAMWICDVWSVVGLWVCALFTLPRVYMKASVYECDSVCEPVGSLPVVCSWRCAYGETETSSGAPLPLLWWKAALIEWPGTQPPFLINSCSIAFNYS